MLALQITENQIVNLISQLDLHMLEKVRKTITKREAYFKKLQLKKSKSSQSQIIINNK